jgi:hypothetical protein
MKLSNEIIEIAKIKALSGIVCDDDITSETYDKFIDPDDNSLDLTIWEPFCEYPEEWLINQCINDFNGLINFAKSILQKTIVTEEDDDIIIESNNISTVLKHNDIGISIDIYDKLEKVQSETQFHFDDYITTKYICPECDNRMKHAMLDVDGTNLEEILECTKCDYYTFDLNGCES